MLHQIQKTSIFRFIAVGLITAMLSAIPVQSGYAQVVLPLPVPGVRLSPTNAFNPPQIVGLKVDQHNPFHFYFVVDQGDRPLSDTQKKQEYSRLIRHFLASLTIPNKDVWVNLSPYEAHRIIGNSFAQTSTGQELLGQDYVLKQFTASLMYPEEDVGRGFWRKVYAQAYDKLGTTDIPVDTFNKIWVRADKAEVYQKDGAAFLVKSHLKVMLEKDYLAEKASHELSSDVQISDSADGVEGKKEFTVNAVREIILPIIEKEVNEGENFAPLRQIYNAMILATWFKQALKASLVNQVYTDKNKVAGVEVDDPKAKDKIYERYLEAFKVGVFNYIKEEEDPLTHETLPRKYFSGGMVGVAPEIISDASQGSATEFLSKPGREIVDTDLVRAIEKTHADLVARRKDLNDETVRAVEQLTARVHFQGEEGKFDGVSYSTKLAAVANLIHFAKERSGIEQGNGEAVFYIPPESPADNVFVLYARQNPNEARIVTNFDDLQDALSKQTAIVFFPFSKSERFDEVSRTAGVKSPQTLLAFSAARVEQSDAISRTDERAKQNGIQGLIVVSDETISKDLRQHRDTRQVAPIHPQEAWQRLDALKKEVAVSSRTPEKKEKPQQVRKKSAPAGVRTSSLKASPRTTVSSDPVWSRLYEEADSIAKKERQLAEYLKKTILDQPDLESAISYLLANKLASEHMDAEDVRTTVKEALSASPDILDAIRRDLLAVLERDPASDKLSTPFLNFKGFHALAAYRVAHWLWLNGRQELALRFQSRVSIAFGVDIHPGATIGKGVVIDHGIGVVVGETAIVGDDVYFLHGVTLGSNGKVTADGRRHPIVGNGVLLGAGASIVGTVTIGDGAKIGANATVSKDVPAGATVVGINEIRLPQKKDRKAIPVEIADDLGIVLTTPEGVSPSSIIPERRTVNTSPVVSGSGPDLPLVDDKRQGRSVVEQVERAVADLETQNLLSEQYAGVSVASGVAGVHLPLRYALKQFALKYPGRTPEIVLVRPAYGGTEGDVELYRKYGLKVRIVSDPENQLVEELSRNTAAVIFETPANPSLPVVDMERVVRTVRNSKSPEAFIIFDGSFATSLGQQPLEYGIDAVVQVVTKGLSGDGNVFGAVVVAKKEIVEELKGLRTEPINEDDAKKLLRYGLPTLEKRFFKQQENARVYVEWLKKNPQVKFVRYPGDESHPQYGIAQRQMNNPGHMIYFDLETEERAKAFMALLRYFRTIEHAVSLGDVRNLMQMPGYGALSGLTDEQLRQGGVTRGGIRWAVGIEDTKDVLRELGAIFQILKLYDGKFDKIPYDQLDAIFMQPTTNVDGKTGYALRKYPVIKRAKKEGYNVEPDILKGIADIGGYVPFTSARIKEAARLIHESTLITKYNPHTLLIHHTAIWGLLSGDHRSLVASGGNPSNAYRADDPDDLKAGFGWNGVAGNPDKGPYLPQGSYRTYGRFGSPASATVQLLLALAEAGARRAFSQEYQGISTPSFTSAVNILLKHWVFDTPKKENGDPIRIVVATKQGSDLERLTKEFQEGDGHLFNLSGNERVEFVTVNTDDQGFLRSSAFDKDADYVLVDEDGLEARRVIQSIKANAYKSKVAWVNTEGIRRGEHPLDEGADITILDIKDGDESVSGVLVVPQGDVTGIGNHRNYNSIAIRRAGEVILPHLFPYLLLPPTNTDSAQTPLGGIDLDSSNLKINIKVDGAGVPLPVQFQDPAMIDIRGLEPVIRSIMPMTPLNMPVLSELKIASELSAV
ncbi:MAG: PLP-dependent transferase [Candidatus Omnitrophica bacterium]|nr:PLP-dependent transferase [Candidatus Omnitrophota bacterium]